MKETKVIRNALICALGVILYIILFSWLLINRGNLFGQKADIFDPILILMILVVSILMTGLLIWGWPIWLYIEGRRKEAMAQVLYTIGWMFILFFILFGLVVLFGK